jgi:hypothetical protein
MDKLLRTDLIKHNLPPMDKNLPFHKANVELMLWNIVSTSMFYMSLHQ